MKIALVVGLVAFFVVCTASLTNSSNPEQLQEWTLFKSKFKKIYKHQKEDVFRRNLYSQYKLKITEHNKLYAKGEVSYELGINQFSDLTEDEIVAMTSCLLPMSMRTINNNQHNTSVVTSTKLERIPPLVDWRHKDCVTPVKDQGRCGSCWAFSAVGSLESQFCIKTGRLRSLSEQNLVDCSRNDSCEGGLANEAFQWIKDNGGIASEMSYPYESTDTWERSCRKHYELYARVKDYKFLPVGDERALEEALMKIGPISVAISVHDDFFGYSGGLYGCIENRELNHEVVVVGFGTNPKGVEYWIVKNSWGEYWGDGGYMHIARNENNQCGIASFAMYPIVE